MDKTKKIQYLLTKHLLENGFIKLLLPDGMEVELGIVGENKCGELEKIPDYSWVIASQKDRVVSMDSYNVGLQYVEKNGKMIVDDFRLNRDGKPTHSFAVA